MRKTKRIIGIGCISACAFILGSCGVRLDNQPNTEKNTQTNTQATTATQIQESTQTSTEGTSLTEETKVAENNNVQEQLQLIAKNKEMWIEEDFTCSYIVTDFNQDGQLEIIKSACQGTGIYTTSTIYEVEEETNELVLYERILGEYISEADIITDSAVVYYDPDNQLYHYIFNDLAKNGAAEYYENIRDWSLQNGKIIENFLAYKSTIYSGAGEEPVITCTNAEKGDKQSGTNVNSKEITEEEYYQMPETVFSGLGKKQVTMNWIMKSPEEITAMNEQEIMAMLEESWNGFHIEDVK